MKRGRFLFFSLLAAALALAGSTAALAITLEVQAPDGQRSELELEPTTWVEDIRAQVRELTGVPIDQQRLLLGYQQLEDETQLEEYHVADGDTLRVLTYRYASTGAASQSDWDGAVTLRGVVESGTPTTQVVAKGIMYKAEGEEAYTQVLSDSLEREYSVLLHWLRPGVRYSYYAFVETDENYYTGEVYTFTPGTTSASFVAERPVR